jgi:hydrogenase nickel incorporation protein HypA/HybF
MHELTLLFGVAEQVEKVTEENGIDHIDAVVLDIGDLTAVIPEFMMDGYQVISDEYDFLRGSELIINRIKGIARCSDCGEDYYVVENEGICPECGSSKKDILTGKEFLIREVRVLEHGEPDEDQAGDAAGS